VTGGTYANARLTGKGFKFSPSDWARQKIAFWQYQSRGPVAWQNSTKTEQGYGPLTMWQRVIWTSQTCGSECQGFTRTKPLVLTKNRLLTLPLVWELTLLRGTSTSHARP